MLMFHMIVITCQFNCNISWISGSFIPKCLGNIPCFKYYKFFRQVTEGKIYVEVERARLTHKLAKIREDEGNIQEAAEIIQELQVETYGSMEKREKVELLLEQMRLCLLKQDYIRTQIISKKINVKFFEDVNTQDLKLKYYKLMMELDQHEGSYLATCKHYRAVLDTPSIQENSAEKQNIAKSVVLYLILAPHDNEQVWYENK